MKYILRALGLAFGALIYTIGLDVFLVPNHVIDGGVVGIALMAAQVTGISFSVFIIILNIPFFIFGYKKIGAFFTISSLFSILCLSGWSTFIHYERVTSDPFLSTIYGGIIIGLGVGLIIRWGGSLDGTEVLAIMPTGARLFPSARQSCSSTSSSWAVRALSFPGTVPCIPLWHTSSPIR